MSEKLTRVQEQGVAPVCNSTLQVIALQIPCIERAGVALDALQVFLRLKY